MAEDPTQRNGVPLKKRTCRHLPALQLGVHITVERELSLINEPQSGKRSYRFCHRGGLEQRIALNFHAARSEEHTSELQSLMRLSYAVFCLKTKKIIRKTTERNDT